MRKPFIAGNWKMNLDASMAKDLAKAISKSSAINENIDVALIPSFTNLYPVKEILNSQNSNIMLGAQNVYFEESGAFTGEISVEMLTSVGCSFTLLGHSERRHIIGETDEMVNKKLTACVNKNFNVVACVGETLQEREAGIHIETVIAQVGKALAGISDKQLLNVIIAYEPVWAIGTGKTASSNDAEEVHKAIRDFINRKYGTDSADNIRIIYGGSVKPENSKELISMKNIDGALVGGASLQSKKFTDIIKNCL